MLCDELIENLADASGCDIRPLLPRIQRAQKFVLEPEFAAVAEALSEDYSGLVRVFDRCRLPYADTWLEVAQADRPRFMASDMHLPQFQVKPKRVGFLLTATRADLSAWKAHLFWSTEFMGCSCALCATIYDMTYPLHHFTSLIPDEKLESAMSVGQHSIGPYKVQSFGPHPGWAHSDEATKLKMANHTDMVVGDYRYVLPGLRDVPPERMKELTRISRMLARADWAGEAPYLLAVIGLLNARNAIETEHVDRTRLNRARIKRGQLPLFEHKTLKIARRQQRRVYGEHGSRGDYAPMRQHFCRGHFKKRASGIFFWHPHLRGDPTRGRVEKEYELE